MKITMLGTGAAEGIPAFYCDCAVCRHAEEAGGRNVRTRPSVLIDGRLKIDHGPDAYAHKLMHGVDYRSLSGILFTHAHDDHLSPTEFIWREHHFIQGEAPPMLVIAGNRSVADRFSPIADRYGMDLTELFERLRLTYCEIAPFRPVSIGDFEIHPVQAAHDPSQVAMNHVITRDNVRVLIGFDTAFYPVETWDYLSRQFSDAPLHCLIMDCTTGKHGGGTTHMGLDDNSKMRDEFVRRGLVTEETRYILTHISHGGGWSHEEIVENAAKEGAEVAYDGMTVEIQ